MKTLKLTLNKQWFDLIEKGIKTEEYSREYRSIYFHLKKTINVTEVIQILENMPPDAGITIDYNPRDLSRCTVVIEEHDFEFELNDRSIVYLSDSNAYPSELINDFQAGYTNFLQLPQIDRIVIE